MRRKPVSARSRLQPVCARWLAAFALLVGPSSLGACTASHDVVGTDQMLVGDAGVAAGSGGTGGRAGRSGSGGEGTGGSPSMGSCGTCADGNLFGFLSVPGCCTDSNTCGLDISGLGLGGCAEMNAPGNADPSCPQGNVFNFVTLEGCCRSDGVCGVLDTYLGLGCTLDTQAPETKCTP